MREDLLGYLLSALEPHEMRRVEQALLENPSLQQELEFLRQTLVPLDGALAELPVVESPCDLVARTMAMLPPLRLPSRDRVAEDSAAEDFCAVKATADGYGVKMAPANEVRRSSRPRLSDVLVAGLASAAVLAFLIPSIARGRYEARRVACQDNLRELGTAITQYVMLNRRKTLPQIAPSGPEAFAGMYAVRLNDSELLPLPAVRWCQEAELPPLPPRPRGSSGSGLNGSAIPVADSDAYATAGIESIVDQIRSSQELYRASESGDVDQLRWAQQTAGGHYAYNLGVVDDDQYEAPHYEARGTFAILGDSPIAGTESADGVDVSRMRWGHRDNGANVLYEDGSVRFLNMASSTPLPDHPFFNHRGSVEAGVNIDDASLAPSWRGPFLSVRQR